MADKIAVRFTQSDPPYNARDVAGFSPDVARQKVRGGVAEFVDAELALQEVNPAPADTVVEVEFGSTAAEKLAVAEEVDLAELKAWGEPSGETGYTKPDVEAFLVFRAESAQE